MISTWDIIHYLKDMYLLSQDHGHLSTVIREAEILHYILSEIPIGIFDGDLIAGDFGHEWGHKDLQLCKQVIDWKQQKEAASLPKHPTPSVSSLMKNSFHCFGGYTSAHTCVNYERVITEGLTGILARVKQEQQISNDIRKTTYLTAISTALNALCQWSNRFSDIAAEQLEVLEKSSKKKQYETISKMCSRVPFQPAASVHEAVQAIWLVHACIGISEGNDSSLSLGRLDQYLYPLYQNDLANGVSSADIESTITALFIKLNRYGDAACTVNLGGVDQNGNDLFNPLSYLIIDIVKKLQKPSPILAARIHQNSPKDVFDSLLLPELMQNGQPTFYGEYACQNAMKKRGIPENECHCWAANSCMGLVMPGEEISDMWGGVVNFLLPLELAINGGKPFTANLPLDLRTPNYLEFATFKELYHNFCCYLTEIIDFCITENNKATNKIAKEQPNPFLSGVIDHCIHSGRDRADGGAKYHTIIIEAFGLINAADALFAIKELVFESKTYNLNQLVAAAKNNFQDSKEILHEIMSLPKFGNNNSAVDQLAAELASFFADTVEPYNAANRIYAPSFHTLNAHIPAGKKMGASLDGRLEGEPLSKNIGPMLGRGNDGHTSMILSASRIDQSRFYGGQALDLSFDLKLLKSKTARTKLIALFQTYFKNGGLQIQVNGINPTILQQAVAHPDNYNDLIVRIAGYSCYFNQLSKDVQQEMIARFCCGQ